MSRFSHVVGFDDAPFDRAHRGDVLVVGVVYSGRRLEGVLSAKVRRDGANATKVLTRLVTESRFAAHLQVVLLQGIALAGFNVVDVHGLHTALGIPIVVVARRQPNFCRIKRALLDRVRGGRRKWTLIERLGPMESAGDVFMQRAGIDQNEAKLLIQDLSISGALPEPLRAAHLIASGVTVRQSRHRA